MGPIPKLKLGFVPAHRGIFSGALARQMRTETLAALGEAGIEVVVPDEAMTKLGCVQDRTEAEKCAALFRAQDVAGIVIGAMTFGDEQAAAWVVRQARLDVPILVFGCQEDRALAPGAPRRDSFCGLLSIAEALRQIGARYSVGRQPICFPRDPAFQADAVTFAAVCRVVRGIRQARYGQIGARPDGFWTCRFDEKKLQRLGPTTVVLDLSEALAGANRLRDDDPGVLATVEAIRAYADTSAVAEASVIKMARFEVFLTRWGRENAIDAFAIQCWTSIQNNFGICACTTMSRLGDLGLPAACEADILGTLSMHACQLASGRPAALADWNNLHNDDDQLVNLWHCGVFPKSLADAQPRLAVHEIIASSGAARPEDAEGVVESRLRPSPVTLARVTQDADGSWKALVVEGAIEENTARTGGSQGWCRVANLPRLYRDVLLRHFPHHVALTPTHVAPALREAFGRYLDFQVFAND